MLALRFSNLHYLNHVVPRNLKIDSEFSPDTVIFSYAAHTKVEIMKKKMLFLAKT